MVSRKKISKTKKRSGKNAQHGDVIKIGNIGSGSAVAVARNASAKISNETSNQEIERLFTTLLKNNQNFPQESREKVTEHIHELKSELSKGEEANDSVVAKLTESIVELAPSALSALVSMFASPILAGLVGPVTRFVLDKLTNKK